MGFVKHDKVGDLKELEEFAVPMKCPRSLGSRFSDNKTNHFLLLSLSFQKNIFFSLFSPIDSNSH